MVVLFKGKLLICSVNILKTDAASDVEHMMNKQIVMSSNGISMAFSAIDCILCYLFQGTSMPPMPKIHCFTSSFIPTPMLHRFNPMSYYT
jgi:hypothetical protein